MKNASLEHCISHWMPRPFLGQYRRRFGVLGGRLVVLSEAEGSWVWFWLLAADGARVADGWV